jgi:hypothetical protein
MPFPDADQIPAEEFPHVLDTLQHLLMKLPSALPQKTWDDSQFSSFRNLSQLPPEILAETEDEASTVSNMLKNAFGWATRSGADGGDGVLVISERGLPIMALATFLHHWISKYPHNEVLKKWVVDIARGAERVYVNHGQQVSLFFCALNSEFLIS